jgi:uncharacterized protein (TIGR03437 family)
MLLVYRLLPQPALDHKNRMGSSYPSSDLEILCQGRSKNRPPVVSGSVIQSGTLSPLPVIKIGGINAIVSFAGLVVPGQFQFNVEVPASLADGDQPIVATYNGATTQPGTLIAIHH